MAPTRHLLEAETRCQAGDSSKGQGDNPAAWIKDHGSPVAAAFCPRLLRGDSTWPGSSTAEISHGALPFPVESRPNHGGLKRCIGANSDILTHVVEPGAMKGVIGWGQSSCPSFHSFPSFLPLPGGTQTPLMYRVLARQTCLQGPGQGFFGQCDKAVLLARGCLKGQDLNLCCTL